MFSGLEFWIAFGCIAGFTLFSYFLIRIAHSYDIAVFASVQFFVSLLGYIIAAISFALLSPRDPTMELDLLTKYTPHGIAIVTLFGTLSYHTIKSKNPIFGVIFTLYQTMCTAFFIVAVGFILKALFGGSEETGERA